MRMEEPGYLRPVQRAPVPPEAEAVIAAICPGLGQSVEAGDRRDNVLWGPYLEMRTGWSTDPALRHHASSGGALSALVIHLLDIGAVEGAVQTRDGLPPVANAAVLSRTPAEVTRAAGSRYAPSAPLAGLASYLEGKGRYAFVGKPCDVAALRALAARDARVSERFPYMISFFCAGVPSQAGAEEILVALDVKPNELAAFRYRGMGWPGRATAMLTDGSERSISYMESWGSILSKHVQHRCKICADGTGVAADIVCADAWEADAKGYPVFDEAPGVSLIVARTETGRSLIEAAEAGGYLETRPFDPAELHKIQPGQTNRRLALFARLLALRIMGRPVPRYTGLRVREVAARNSFLSNMRNFLGMLRRVAIGRL
jgi:coenzyme F420 hydrogenase subunit beta